MEKLYNYIFWFNCYEDKWYAIPSNQQISFFNGNRDKVVGLLFDKDINKLIKKIK